MSTNPTNVPTADDVAALQALARGSSERRGLTTLLIHCGITGQPERVRLGDLFSVVEPWTMDGEVVPVLKVNADKFFVDTFDEERIAGTTVWDVLWQDADGQEHRARLTDVTISRLEDHLEQASQEDWYGPPRSYEPEILRVEAVATPAHWTDLLRKIASKKE